jgi:surface antigen
VTLVSKKLFVSLALFGVAAASCSGGDTGPTPPASPTASTSPTSTTPPRPAVQLTGGVAQLTISGGIQAKETLPMGRGSAYQAPPGSMDVTWVDDEGNALLLQGESFEGTANSSQDLFVSLVIQSAEQRVFSSATGDCTVFLSTVQARRFTGSVECHRVGAGGTKISVTGTISGKA